MNHTYCMVKLLCTIVCYVIGREWGQVPPLPPWFRCLCILYKKVQSKFTSIAKLVQLCYNIIQLISSSCCHCPCFVVLTLLLLLLSYCCPCFAVVVILLVIVNCFVYQLLLCHKQHGMFSLYRSYTPSDGNPEAPPRMK